MLNVTHQTHSPELQQTKMHVDRAKPVCPLTGSNDITVLETIPTSLLIACYQRDLGIDVSAEFTGVKNLQLCHCKPSDVMFFFPAITGSQKFYRQLHSFEWYFPESKFEYDHAATWITHHQQLLDIGCGATQFAQKFPQMSYTGLDPNYVLGNSRKHTNRHILSQTLDEHAMTHVQTYDVVCAFQVLEHVAHPDMFLTTALTCLKPGGLLILGVPSAKSYVTQIANFVLNAPPHHVTWWTNQSLLRLAGQFQLSVLDIAHAPVESWETRLYWMQRITAMLLPRKTSYFTELRSYRLATIAAFLGAGLIMPFLSLPASAQGSTVVMVARKKDVSIC